MKLRKQISLFTATVMLSIALSSATAFAADYTIAPKDTLYTISRLFNTSVSQIKADNHLTSDWIYPGQLLNVPGAIYTVKSGDSMYLIAKNNGITLDTLRKANNKWDNMIIPGQKLVLPGSLSNSTISSVATKTVIPYTKAEVDLLARLIAAEARGESYEAMVGVGGAVVNRVQSNDWPNSISSVINQVINGYHQFTPVKNGQIQNSATDDSIKAAWAVLYGKDASNGAMFYFDDSSTNQWMWSKTITARIDSMVFVK